MNISTAVNMPLIIGAALSAIAALLHVAIIFGGPKWYRFFGAGERFASAAEAGLRYPTQVTLGIASMLMLWSAYALSGAGIIAPLPLLKPALVAITAIYLIRALGFVPLIVLSRKRLTAFAWWSSLVCLVYGGVYLLGLVQRWDAL